MQDVNIKTQVNPQCPYCSNLDIRKSGSAYGVPYFFCKKCEKYFSRKTVIKTKGTCYRCGGINTCRDGLSETKTQIYYCKDCHKKFTETKTLPSEHRDDAISHGNKKCKICNILKPIGEFNKSKTSKDGHSYICRECIKIRGVIAKLKKYNIKEEEYNKMFIIQNHACAICKTPFNDENDKKEHIDHCHKTGIVRGLLCHACNKILGFARDDVNILEQAILYLKIN